MKEILFRGKRIDNGEWIVGSLHLEYYQHHGVVMIASSEDDIFKVNPSTVGQYIGLTDKNGINIFTGDIIDFRPDGTGIFVVQEGQFVDTDMDEEIYGYYIEQINGPDICSFNGEEGNTCRVVGNIHDNPELLEVKE